MVASISTRRLVCYSLALCVAITPARGLAEDIAAGETPAGKASAGQAAFFESKIRPALIEHCAECHWSDTEASGGLLLDSKVGWQQGGDLGPAIVPGNASESVLIKAIEYDDPSLEMPPDGKLDEQTIAAFRKWIEGGAYDPRESEQTTNKAKDSGGLSVERAHEHWAYRPLVLSRDAAPRMDRHGSSEVDRLINQRIRESGLTAAPPADRARLVRRLVFDLHGLPPTREQVETFVADSSPMAYERLVDRLLASPRFAEHFARRWMDVVRYAESITLRGFILPQAWRYRDYVIGAYAQDRPFDQMIRDQIAGDLLPTADRFESQQRAIATGFLAMGNSNLEDQDKTKLEFDHIDEQLETIGRAFLAQTIGCARCHDHKFDPIPTRDYYALAGIMRSTTPLEHANLSKWIERPLPLDSESETHYRDLEQQLARVSFELDALKSGPGNQSGAAGKSVPVASLDGVVVDDSEAIFVGDWKESEFVRPFVGQGYRHDQTSGQGSKTATFEPKQLESGLYEVRMSYSPHSNRATNVRVRVFSANESTTILVNQRKRPPEDGVWISLGVFPFEKQGQSFVIVSNEEADGCVIADAIQFLPVKEEQRSATVNNEDLNPAAADAEAEKIKRQRDRLTREQKALQSKLAERPKYLTILEGEPREEIAIRIRGNVHQMGDAVPRGFLSAIGPAAEYAQQIESDRSGRVELANWIADPENPLTARVYANRVWSWLMGEGLVATENNFGTTGEAPSHPELLDRLSAELVRGGWSTKHLVRVIVHSDAYRRGVSQDPDRIAADPGNRLFASASMRRVPVEAIRDAMLSVSGELDLGFGGSLIRGGTKSDYDYRHDSLRRSVYSPVFRNSLPPLFSIFDFADSSVSIGQRSRSTVAPQSLAMMNHPWVIERAKRAAERYRQELPGASKEHLVRQLYWDCFGRNPDAAELQLCLDYLDSPSQVTADDRFVDLIQSLFASIDFRYLE